MSVIRIQLEGPPEFSFSLGPLPVPLQRDAKQDVCLGKPRIKFQRFAGGIDYLWAYFARGSADEN